MIIKGLKMHFPQLKIIGEENEEYKGNISYSYDQLKVDMLPTSSNINRELKI
jgi:3'-phosphoadenosine 5'-phosphosulfate (PAPS) 3'-phosphatase